MYIWLSPTPPALHVGHLPDPLVGYHLPAEYDGTAAVQHGHVAPAVPLDVVPEHGRPGPGPGPDSQAGEDCETSSLDTGEVEHQGRHPVPSRVALSTHSLHWLRYVVVVLVDKQGVLLIRNINHFSIWRLSPGQTWSETLFGAFFGGFFWEWAGGKSPDFSRGRLNAGYFQL